MILPSPLGELVSGQHFRQVQDNKYRLLLDFMW